MCQSVDWRILYWQWRGKVSVADAWRYTHKLLFSALRASIAGEWCKCGQLALLQTAADVDSATRNANAPVLSRATRHSVYYTKSLRVYWMDGEDENGVNRQFHQWWIWKMSDATLSRLGICVTFLIIFELLLLFEAILFPKLFALQLPPESTVYWYRDRDITSEG